MAVIESDIPGESHPPQRRRPNRHGRWKESLWGIRYVAERERIERVSGQVAKVLTGAGLLLSLETRPHVTILNSHLLKAELQSKGLHNASLPTLHTRLQQYLQDRCETEYDVRAQRVTLGNLNETRNGSVTGVVAYDVSRDNRELYIDNRAVRDAVAYCYGRTKLRMMSHPPHITIARFIAPDAMVLERAEQELHHSDVMRAGLDVPLGSLELKS